MCVYSQKVIISWFFFRLQTPDSKSPFQPLRILNTLVSNFNSPEFPSPHFQIPSPHSGPNKDQGVLMSGRRGE